MFSIICVQIVKYEDCFFSLSPYIHITPFILLFCLCVYIFLCISCSLRNKEINVWKDESHTYICISPQFSLSDVFRKEGMHTRWKLYIVSRNLRTEHVNTVYSLIHPLLPLFLFSSIQSHFYTYVKCAFLFYYRMGTYAFLYVNVQVTIFLFKTSFV